MVITESLDPVMSLFYCICFSGENSWKLYPFSNQLIMGKHKCHHGLIGIQFIRTIYCYSSLCNVSLPITMMLNYGRLMRN